MKASQILKHLERKGSSKALEAMAKLGISTKRAYGVEIAELRRLAKHIGPHHQMAEELWKSGVHEARILAAYIDDPKKVSERQMEEWVRDFDSWDICDQVCGSLFEKTDFAHKKAIEWAHRKEEYVKRAGFALMALLAAHDRNAGFSAFEKFFPHIISECHDERKYVKKAVNWALRQIGKRSMRLNRRAVEVARQILQADSPSAKWIASNALRELESDAVQKRLEK